MLRLVAVVVRVTGEVVLLIKYNLPTAFEVKVVKVNLVILKRSVAS